MTPQIGNAMANRLSEIIRKMKLYKGSLTQISRMLLIYQKAAVYFSFLFGISVCKSQASYSADDKNETWALFGL